MVKRSPRLSLPAKAERTIRSATGFNELVNGWRADHIFKHDPNAIECFLLIAFLAFNIFHAFFVRNLKPLIRQGRTQAFWSRLMAAEIYTGINPAISP